MQPYLKIRYNDLIFNTKHDSDQHAIRKAGNSLGINDAKLLVGSYATCTNTRSGAYQIVNNPMIMDDPASP